MLAILIDFFDIYFLFLGLDYIKNEAWLKAVLCALSEIIAIVILIAVHIGFLPAESEDLFLYKYLFITGVYLFVWCAIKWYRVHFTPPHS